MKALKKCVVVLFVLSIAIEMGWGKNIARGDIDVSLASIQVGAFKEQDNILNLMRQYWRFDTFVEKSRQFDRFYIVNIPNNQFATLLEEVHHLHPSAFSARKKITSLLGMPKKTYPQTEAVKTQTATFPRPKSQYIYHDTRRLDTRSILQTRKKFF